MSVRRRASELKRGKDNDSKIASNKKMKSSPQSSEESTVKASQVSSYQESLTTHLQSPTVPRLNCLDAYPTLSEVKSQEPHEYPWMEVPRELVVCLHKVMDAAFDKIGNTKVNKQQRVPTKPDLWKELSKFCQKDNADCVFHIPTRPKSRESEGLVLVSPPFNPNRIGCKSMNYMRSHGIMQVIWK